MSYGRHRIEDLIPQDAAASNGAARTHVSISSDAPQFRHSADPTLSQPKPDTIQQPKRRRPIGQILVDMGAVSPKDILKAAAMRQRENTRIGAILLAHGMVDEQTLYRAIGLQYDALVADFDAQPPDVRLIDQLGADDCLRNGMLPWRLVGGTTIIASCRPEEFAKQRARLTAIFGPVRLAVTSETALHEALLRTRQNALANHAETRVAAEESCREIDIKRLSRVLSIAGITGLVIAIANPDAAFIALTAWAVLTLVINSSLKVAAVFMQARHGDSQTNRFLSHRSTAPLPIVSVMVPLFREREITGRLIKRLSRINYPRELLDICLVVEDDDQVTQAAIATADLPRWMRQITVPPGGVKTKPRALNFALDFCRGSIVGIWDAEDAPEPEQIHKVVRHFDTAKPDVACLQGILDFYNTRTNWLSRCFAVEYASWFRAILPGYEQMGLVIPLGGTTLFFRREAIDELGGWDAHNVTEDADLGLRLARHGYRTELIPTVTQEEANCRPWPWIKQRSRWLKGYAMTWAVHMRSPVKLWRDLGPWRFFGVQALFLGTLSQFVLAPFLWSFWAIVLGLPHPLRDALPHEAFIALGTLFILSEVATVAVGMFATATARHKWLWPWVPTLHLYYPLATAAAIKGLWEILTRPYYWDKTDHGVADNCGTFVNSGKKAHSKLPPAPVQPRPTVSPAQPRLRRNTLNVETLHPQAPQSAQPVHSAQDVLLEQVAKRAAAPVANQTSPTQASRGPENQHTQQPHAHHHPSIPAAQAPHPAQAETKPSTLPAFLRADAQEPFGTSGPKRQVVHHQPTALGQLPLPTSTHALATTGHATGPATASPTSQKATTAPTAVRQSPPAPRKDPQLKRAIAIASSAHVLEKTGFSEPSTPNPLAADRADSRFLTFVPSIGGKRPRRKLRLRRPVETQV